MQAGGAGFLYVCITFDLLVIRQVAGHFLLAYPTQAPNTMKPIIITLLFYLEDSTIPRSSFITALLPEQ